MHFKTETVPLLLFMQSYAGALALICIRFLVSAMNIPVAQKMNRSSFLLNKSEYSCQCMAHISET